MSDVATADARNHDWRSAESSRRLRRRYAADRRLQMLGIAAIAFAILLLAILIGSLIFAGYTAFFQTKVTIEVYLDPQLIDRDEPQKGNYRKLFQDAVQNDFRDVENRRERVNIQKIFTSEAAYQIRNYAAAHPEDVGRRVALAIPLSDPFDQLHKGVIPRQIAALTPQAVAALDRLRETGRLDQADGRTVVRLDITIDPQAVDAQDPAAGNYRRLMLGAVNALLPQGASAGTLRLLADDAADTVKAYVVANPQVIGTTLDHFPVPLAPDYDRLNKGEAPMMRNPRFASEAQLLAYDRLVARDAVSMPFNWALFTAADSRFPEQAGLAGAIVGSFYALLVCFLISFPVGIAAAVYLEEFAIKNRWTDLIEVNINNLAAVPSVVFGLLGLAVFLGAFGLPRSAPLVGGMVLSLMTLPTIIIATRAALKAVPPSIREAALGIGASRQQVIMHHVLPLAMPGILTGTIIGLAQALGETAPLLLIGMNAFIPSIDNMGILQPATALPAQIFSWADSPERGFVAKTSAAILVLLGFLVVMNGVAIYLRQRFERKW